MCDNCCKCTTRRGVIFTLKDLLKEKGITQIELSEKTGIRLATISDICNNKIKQFPVSSMNLICGYLNCIPADFITYMPK